MAKMGVSFFVFLVPPLKRNVWSIAIVFYLVAASSAGAESDTQSEGHTTYFVDITTKGASPGFQGADRVQIVGVKSFHRLFPLEAV